MAKEKNDSGEKPLVETPIHREAISIPKVDSQTFTVEIEGITPLVVCRWSEKARQQMADAQGKKARGAKAAKNPEEDYRSSLYVSTEGWTGVPAGGIKGCLVNACRAVDGLPMTLAKRMIFVMGQGQTADGQELVRIYGEHHLWMNPVRIAGGTADLRYRGRYDTWSAILEINYLKNIVSMEQICSLINLAGFVEGLCEWRPGSPKNNTGNMGRFRIKDKGQQTL